MPRPVHPIEWSQQVVNFLKTFLPKQNLETFKKDLEHMNRVSPNKHYEIREFIPLRDGVAFACEYDTSVPVSKPPMKSSYAHIEQYWNKDGKCIGFSFEGKQFMFPAKNNSNRVDLGHLLPQSMRDALNDFYSRRTDILAQIPKGSELDKFIKKHPTAQIDITTDKNGKINRFDVVYATRVGQTGRRPNGILYGEMIESHAMFDEHGRFVGESEKYRDAGIKSANFKSAQSKVSAKSEAKTLERIAAVDKEH